METRDGAGRTGRGSTQAEQLQRRNHELRILFSVSEELNKADNVETALEQSLALVADLLGLRSAWVWLLDDEGRPYLAASRQLPPFLREPARMEGWLCHCLETFTRGDMEGAANINVLECSRLRNAATGSEGLRYHASIPLYLGETRVGVMNVAGPDWRRLGPDELDLLHAIGNQVAVAVERSRLAEKAAISARLEERNRLARDIHDTLAQELAAVALHLETADVLLPDAPAAGAVRVKAALRLVREALDEARRSVLNLRAAPLEGATLQSALHHIGDEAARRGGLRVDVNVEPELPYLSVDAETAICRLVQEALANVLKHASAERAQVALHAAGSHLHLEISDNGRGFDAEQGDMSGRFGLVGMRERARLLGGDLQVRSAPGEGTLLVASLPLPSHMGGIE